MLPIGYHGYCVAWSPVLSFWPCDQQRPPWLSALHLSRSLPLCTVPSSQARVPAQRWLSIWSLLVPTTSLQGWGFSPWRRHASGCTWHACHPGGELQNALVSTAVAWLPRVGVLNQRTVLTLLACLLECPALRLACTTLGKCSQSFPTLGTGLWPFHPRWTTFSHESHQIILELNISST